MKGKERGGKVMVGVYSEPRADEEFNRKHNKVAFGTGVPAINPAYAGKGTFNPRYNCQLS